MNETLGIDAREAGRTAPLRSCATLFIGGQWVDPVDGGVVESLDPATGKPWARVAFGGAKDIDRAVAAAREAFNGPWRRMPVRERAALLRRLADLYRDFAPEMAVLEFRDSGRAIREARADIGARHNWYQWFASRVPAPRARLSASSARSRRGTRRC